jgi:hypothetical protein
MGIKMPWSPDKQSQPQQDAKRLRTPEPQREGTEPSTSSGLGNIDHTDVVARIRGQLESAGVDVHTVAGAFEITKRVAWELRSEGAGLLIKTAGENIWNWNGMSFSAARICYPDGALRKILTDVPTTDNPEWADDGTVTTDRYVPAIDPGPLPGQPPTPPTPPDTPDTPSESDAAILAKLDTVITTVQGMSDALRQMAVQLDRDVAATEGLRRDVLNAGKKLEELVASGVFGKLFQPAKGKAKPAAKPARPKTGRK